MNSKKTRDWYYIQLKGLRQMSQEESSSLNKCLKTAKVLRIDEKINEDSKIDFTKCIAYKACNKDPDWLDAVATTATELYTTTPFVYNFTPDEPYKN